MPSPRYALTELANNAGNVQTVNGSFRVVEAFLGGATVVDRDLLAEPGSPSEGDLYLLPASGSLTGTMWSTFTNGNFALYANGAWEEITVDAGLEGCRIHVADEDAELTYRGATDGWMERPLSVAAGVAASGNAQGAGYSVATAVVEVVSATAGVNDSVDLPAAVAGAHHVIANASAAAIDVYPATGGSIDGLATNASLSVAAGATVRLFATSTTQWYSI